MTKKKVELPNQQKITDAERYKIYPCGTSFSWEVDKLFCKSHSHITIGELRAKLREKLLHVIALEEQRRKDYEKIAASKITRKIQKIEKYRRVI
jgi:hypothetical protein